MLRSDCSLVDRAEFTEKVKPEVVIDFERFFVMVSRGESLIKHHTKR